MATFLVWAASVVAVLVLAVNVPVLRARLHTAPLSRDVWGVALAASMLLPSWWELWKWLRRRRSS